MVWDQGPSIALGLRFFEDDSQAIKEGFSVLVIAEELSAFYSPGHYMLQYTWGVESGLSWHSIFGFSAGINAVTIRIHSPVLLDQINYSVCALFMHYASFQSSALKTV